MEDTELFTKLLGIQPPWRVTRVQVTMAAERIDVWVEEMPGTQFPCAVPLCVNMSETLIPKKFRVEGEKGLGDEFLE